MSTSFFQVQFLRKAVDVLCLCRNTLKYTYVFAFYLKKNNQSVIFEVNISVILCFPKLCAGESDTPHIFHVFSSTFETNRVPSQQVIGCVCEGGGGRHTFNLLPAVQMYISYIHIHLFLVSLKYSSHGGSSSIEFNFI